MSETDGARQRRGVGVFQKVIETAAKLSPTDPSLIYGSDAREEAAVEPLLMSDHLYKYRRRGSVAHVCRYVTHGKLLFN